MLSDGDGNCWSSSTIPDQLSAREMHPPTVRGTGRAHDNAAVVFEERQLTYAQLNACANQLAHHLQALGVGPDALVAICMERSLRWSLGFGVLPAALMCH
jgi:non-ribosomal peptide synthetase component F